MRTIEIQLRRHTVICGTIRAGTPISYWHIAEPQNMFLAESAFDRPPIEFYTGPAAELWLKTVAAIEYEEI